MSSQRLIISCLYPVCLVSYLLFWIKRNNGSHPSQVMGRFDWFLPCFIAGTSQPTSQIHLLALPFDSQTLFFALLGLFHPCLSSMAFSLSCFPCLEHLRDKGWKHSEEQEVAVGLIVPISPTEKATHQILTPTSQSDAARRQGLQIGKVV